MNDRTRLWPLRRVATRFIDPVLRPLAGRLPVFGIIQHRGRSSGRLYRTPVNVPVRRHVLDLPHLRLRRAVGEERPCGGRLHDRDTQRDARPRRSGMITDPQLTPAPPIARFVERHLAGATRYLRMRAQD